MRGLRAIIAAAGIVAAAGASGQETATATATLVGPDGAELGTATFTETPHGVLVTAELSGFPAGVHGFHLHDVGSCAPDFSQAGGHYNPAGAEHGFLSEGGPHAGDMPNIHVPESGALTIEVMNTYVSFEGENPIFDADGTTLMIHAGADDYSGQPAGNSGDRIACGVIER
jgi:Cu-Zn family superoxide dismutase